MEYREVSLPDGSYSDAAKSFADQQVVGRWAEYSVATGTRSPKKLADCPGLREFASFGDGPHRAGRVIDSKAFVLADSHFYQMHSATEVEQLGSVPGRSRGWITANKSQVVVSTGPDAWVFSLIDRSFTKITDPAFVGFISPDFINQMIIGIDRSRRFLYNSALEGQDDGALSYNDLERYESEGNPDRLVCSLVRGFEVLVFNEKTTEVFGGTQGADVTNHILFRNKRISSISHGCASPHGACIVGGEVLFVGDDGNGYLLSGYTAVPITPPPIVQAWAQCDLSKCFTQALETEGHLVWYVTFPDGHTWGYDLVASRLTGRAIWHQRESYNLKRWRLNTLFQWRPPGERTPSWFGGSFNSGMVYRLDDAYSLEGCDPLVRRTRTGISHAQGNKRRTGAVRIEYNSGSALSVCEDVEPIPFPENTNPHFAYMGNENSLNYYKVGYGYVDLETNLVTELASKEFEAWATVQEGLIEGNGEFYGLVSYDNNNPVDEQVSGLYCFRYDGGSTLTTPHSWQISGSQYHIYKSVFRKSNGTFIVLCYDEDLNHWKLVSLSYSSGSGWTQTGSLDFGDGNERGICLHNDYIIVTLPGGAPTLKAYSEAAGTFTLAGTYVPGTALISAYTLCSNGSHIVTQLFQAFTFNGSAFAMTFNGNINCRDQRFDADGRLYRATTADLKVYDTSFSQIGATLTFSAIHDAFLTIGVVEGTEIPEDWEAQSLIFVPSATGYAAQHGTEVYFPTSLAGLEDYGDVVFPFSVTPTAVVILPIEALT